MKAAVTVSFNDGSSLADQLRSFESTEQLLQHMRGFAERVGRFRPVASIRAIAPDGTELVDLVLRDVQLRPDPDHHLPPPLPPPAVPREEAVWPAPQPARARVTMADVLGPPSPAARPGGRRHALASILPEPPDAA